VLPARSLAVLLLAATATVATRSEPRDQSSIQPGIAYIITREDISRAGAATIPEVLEMIPGLHAAQLDGAKWEVTVRRPAARFTGAILLLLDGISTSTSRYPAGYWDQDIVPLAAIERIEMWIPGAETCGAGPLQGGINLVTHATPQPRDSLPPRVDEPRSLGRAPDR